MTINRIHNAIFFLIIFFLCSQFGLHFWPKFAYIIGARVDYLSPTLYLLDILILVFTIPFLFDICKRRELFIPQVRVIKFIFIFFILDLVLNLFLSRSPGAHIFGIIKLIEFVLFAICVSIYFKKRHISYFVDTLGLAAIVSSILAIWQYINQSSVGGLWYFLGERTFDSVTIGISTVNLSHQILRPYAAFPHPNVLAFFLLTAIIFMILRFPYERENRERIFLIFATAISSIALLLTFSRVSIFLLVALSIYAFYTKGKRNLLYLVSVIMTVFALIIVTMPDLLSANFLFRGIDFREQLFQQAKDMISTNLYFGVGINNFFIHQAPLIKTISPIVFQPVHNIFVLAFVSLGLLGFWAVPLIFVLAIRSLFAKVKNTDPETKDFYKSVLLVLIAIIIVGMFDHFFLTLEQGQIMLALVIGLVFTRLKS